MKAFRWFVWSALALASGSGVLAQQDIGTAFTYQGTLENGSGPVTDTCDFRFGLWDADTAGAQVGGSPLTVGLVDVVSGSFTAALDFGANAINGDARWLEIEVQCPGDAGFVLLSPRVELTPAPHATRAVSGVGPPNAIEIDSANGLVGIGTAAPAQPLHVVGTMLSENPGTSPAGSTVRFGGPSSDPGVVIQRGDGVGGVARQWDIVVEHTNDLEIRDNTAGGLERMVIDTTGRVGIGTITPGEQLTVAGTVHSTTGGFKFPDGSTQTTAASGGGTGSTLDSAYDQGGPGAGRIITADTGPVEIQGNDGLLVAGVIRSTTGGFELPDGTVLDTASDLGLGDITAVTAGTGLSGGGTSGSVTLNVAYAGNGAANSSARSDHYHSTLAASDGNPLNAIEVDAAGNVGIGTATPSAKLDINGSLEVDGSTLVVDPVTNSVGIGTVSPSGRLDIEGSGATTKLEINNTGTNGDPIIQFQLNDTAVFSMGVEGTFERFMIGTTGIDTDTRLTINHLGHVGIGTSEPTAHLHLESGDATTSFKINNTADGDPIIRFDLSGAHVFTMGVDNSDGDKFKIGTIAPETSTRMTIDSSGNVGIGTTTPESRLHLAGGSDASLGSGGFLTVGTTTAANIVIDNNEMMARNNGAASPLSLNTDGGNIHLVPFGTGNVGIGTDDPSAKLDVVGSLEVDTDTLYVNSTTDRVGIGTTAPTQALHVIGNACVTGTVGACSDARYKTDVARIDDALSLISRLRGVHFNWLRDQYPDREFSDQPQVGFIAQEIAEVVPEVVTRDDDGYYWVDYGRLTPVIVEAIKAQNRAMEDQQNLIVEKDCKIEELEARLTRLEAMLNASHSIEKGEGR